MPEFPTQLPHGDLSEVLPDIFIVSGEVRPDFGGNSMQFSRNMIVVRDSGALTLINTLRLDDAGLARLESLGTVTNLVKLGSFHGRDDGFYIDRYHVPLWAPAKMPHERGVTSDRTLEPGQPGPVSDASVFTFETASMPEAILHLAREGGVLISCDSLQNWTGPDRTPILTPTQPKLWKAPVFSIPPMSARAGAMQQTRSKAISCG